MLRTRRQVRPPRSASLTEGNASLFGAITEYAAPQLGGRIVEEGADGRERVVDDIKSGERSESVGTSLRELESYLRAEKATLSKAEKRKPLGSPGVLFVAGAGFEPATFGL